MALDEIEQLVGAAAQGARGEGPRSDREVPQAVLAAPAFAGPIDALGVAIEDLDGQVVHLTPADLRAIDGRHVADEHHADEDDPGPLDASSPPIGAAAAAGDRPPDGGPPLPGGDARVPIYFLWHEEVGPLLSLGMLSAAARSHRAGALNEQYEIRRPEPAEAILRAVAEHRGPAVLACSDYVYTLDANLDIARRCKELNPELVVLHGGPSSPKYPGDAEQFLRTHADAADVLTRGEGEHLFVELLEALAPTLPARDPARLASVAGITYRDPTTDAVVRTPDRDRIADLDALPSPYLTGEFDHIDPMAWIEPPAFETNRGCPYACTFCDWGSATNSRIRRFDLDRVAAEIEWSVDRGMVIAMLCDSNFGILARDVDMAGRIADIRRRRGAPELLIFTPSKNRIVHLLDALDTLLDADVSVLASISLQTTDEETLRTVGRQNISIDGYLALAAYLRRRGHALSGDLILGLPGQTVASYRADLQFMIDHEIMGRTFPLRLLPNAPINEPEHRRRHAVEVDPTRVVRATATMSPTDREHMLALHTTEVIVERMGLLRHVLRFLQWDHGIPATEVIEALATMSDDDAVRLPILSWTLRTFDRFALPAIGWEAFTRDVRRFVLDDLGVEPSSALDAVLRLQAFLLPRAGRVLPAAIELEHDYVAYYAAAVRPLYLAGRAVAPTRRLADFGSAPFVVAGDPLSLCTEGLRFNGDASDPRLEADFHVGAIAANELDSMLLRRLPRLASYRSPSTQAFVDLLDLPPLDPSAITDEALTGSPGQRAAVVAPPRRRIAPGG
ncbi:B12-binding domain-containing radical SAM protein [Aquihabitans sp. McL0605]|uniref:B12-binding domain-containing radical SAM protein n=1 Tax=Aquihabitans sp. McL0605 TaxID=3415671 RepID=UPI003CEA8170